MVTAVLLSVYSQMYIASMTPYGTSTVIVQQGSFGVSLWINLQSTSRLSVVFITFRISIMQD